MKDLESLQQIKRRKGLQRRKKERSRGFFEGRGGDGRGGDGRGTSCRRRTTSEAERSVESTRTILWATK